MKIRFLICSSALILVYLEDMTGVFNFLTMSNVVHTRELTAQLIHSENCHNVLRKFMIFL